MTGTLSIPASPGEVADKISILRLKVERIADPGRVANVGIELDALRAAWTAAGLPELESLPEWPELVAVNTALWEVEDALREHEGRQDFGQAFVALARSVYRHNDHRAAIKKRINLALGSRIVEEKSW